MTTNTTHTNPTTTGEVVRIAPRLFGALRTDDMVDGRTVSRTRVGAGYASEFVRIAPEAKAPALDEVDWAAYGA